jgi:hypothetical protein
VNLEKIILRKLFRRRIIGGKHTALEHVTASIPKNLHKDAKKDAEKLIKKDLIKKKPTGYGLHISLNPDKLDDILQILEEE